MKFSNISEHLQGQGYPGRDDQSDGAAGDCRAPSNTCHSDHHNLCSQTPSESDGLSCQLFRIIRILQLRELVVSEVK